MQQFNQDQNALVWLTMNHQRFQVPAEGIEDIINSGLKHDHYHSANVRVIVNDSRGGFVSTDKQQIYQLEHGWGVVVSEGGSRSDDQSLNGQSENPNYSRNSSEHSQHEFLNLSNTFGPNWNRNRHSEGSEKASFRSLQEGFQALDTTGKGKTRHISVSPSPSVLSQASGQSYSHPGPSDLSTYKKNKRVWSPSKAELQMKRRHFEELQELQEGHELEASHLNDDGQGSEYSQVTGLGSNRAFGGSDRGSVDPMDDRSFLSRLSSGQGNHQVNNGSPSDSTRSYGTVPRTLYPQPGSDDGASYVCSDDHGYDSDASTSTAGQKNAAHPAKPASRVRPISISLTDPLPLPSAGKPCVVVLVTEIPAEFWNLHHTRLFREFLGRQRVYTQDCFWIKEPSSVKYKALLYVARTKADDYMTVIMSPIDKEDRKKNYGMKANYFM